MKKFLKALVMAAIMTVGFSGCGGSDGGDNVTKEKANDMLGVWNITATVNSTNVPKTLILTDVGEDEDNEWAAVGVGQNYVDMAWYDTEDECYYAGTYYDDGSIDGFTFKSISDSFTIAGDYIMIDTNKNAYGPYSFTGYRSSVDESIRSVKKVNKIEVRAEEKNQNVDSDVVSKIKAMAEKLKK